MEYGLVVDIHIERIGNSDSDNEHHDDDNDDDDDADNDPNDREDDWRHSHLTSRLRLLTSTAICDHCIHVHA